MSVNPASTLSNLKSYYSVVVDNPHDTGIVKVSSQQAQNAFSALSSTQQQVVVKAAEKLERGAPSEENSQQRIEQAMKSFIFHEARKTEG